MALTSDEETVVRSWVGTTVSIDVLNERHDRLGTLNGVVLEELRAQLTELSSQPSSLTLPSGLSVQITQNITELQQRIKMFELSADLDGDVELEPGFGRMKRKQYR